MTSLLDIIWLFDILNVKLTCPEVNVKNKVEEMRKEKGISQAQLAEFMEVSRQTISSIENGRYNPSVILAYNLATYFGMLIEELFEFERESYE